ncbi:lipopolysaccharide assembly protein LapB [Sutterella sp.]|uniref:lipopolysaccharide assembly protein LapB n=1 Tax=Sutterella sp. TaxID=1981025 RepID=UPI0026DF8126|nr:lipopolysaccharide assembly protein LapB [Sutterella sp.]MDO5532792.1 lipopolysaccharide assembly protein LapB [Sutterella sp.]
MELDYWYLLFVPILFFAGWWCRGWDQRQRGGAAKVPEVCSRGLALLLDGAPDKAIDAFIEVVRVDPELTELERVLGNLMRSRGEFERAVRLHRHLYNRADLSDEERALALKELARDFLCAGFFDRAEAAYRKLSNVPSEHLHALRELLKIYVTEHEWAAATETARLLETQAGENHANEIAHFYCERIDIALRMKKVEEARLLVEPLLRYRDATPRVPMTIAKVAVAEGAGEEAVRWWKDVIEKTPDYAPLVLGHLADAMAAAGNQAGAVDLLLELTEKVGTADVLEVALSRIAGWKGVPAAEKLAREMLEKHPSLSAYMAMMQMRLKGNPEDEMTKLVAGLLERNARKWSRHQCKRCGFLASSFSWHCLGCGAWDSFSPRRIEDTRRG